MTLTNVLLTFRKASAMEHGIDEMKQQAASHPLWSERYPMQSLVFSAKESEHFGADNYAVVVHVHDTENDEKRYIGWRYVPYFLNWMHRNEREQRYVLLDNVAYMSPECRYGLAIRHACNTYEPTSERERRWITNFHGGISVNQLVGNHSINFAYEPERN